MFSDVKRLLGAVTVVEKNGTITVEGLPADVYAREISRIWSTSRINKNMFTNIGKSKVSFPSFFVIEFIYALNTILEESRSPFAKRTIRRVIELLEERTWLNREHVSPILDFSRLERFNIKMLPHQMEFLQRYDIAVPKFDLTGYLLAAVPGAGKAQPLDCKVKIPNGWKTMGDVEVGDVVSTPDGKNAKVLGVFPQGIKDIYEITFVDGRKTRACAEHLWVYYNSYDHTADKLPIVGSTEELSSVLHANRSEIRKPKIPLITNDSDNYRILPLEPYVLGLLLGDGGLTRSVFFTNPEEQLVKSLAASLPEHLKLTQCKGDPITYRICPRDKTTANTYLEILRDMDLMGKYSFEKHVPEEYLHASREQRLALVKGLMDTDGTVDKQGTCQFCTSSKVMALQMQYLIRSLGGIARIKPKIPYYTHKGERRQGRLAYILNIRHPKPSELFDLQRKKDRCNDRGQYCERLRLRVESIEFVGKQEAKCIMIDHPSHLYITDDFIVTHNTFSGLALHSCLKTDAMIVVCPKNAVTKVWVDNIDRFIVDKPKVWHSAEGVPPRPGMEFYICHYEYLTNFVEYLDIFKGRTVMVDLDECHNFNDPNSQRTQAFIQMCKTVESKHVVWASGTPLKAMAKEMIGFLRTVDPYFTPKVEERFKAIFGMSVGRAGDILSHRLGLVSFKVGKERFMSDVPIVNRVDIKIPNSERFTLATIRQEMVDFIKARMEHYRKNGHDYRLTYESVLKTHEATLVTPEQRKRFVEYKRVVAILRKASDYRHLAAEMKYSNDYEASEILPQLSGASKEAFRKAKGVYKYVELVIRGEALGGVLGRRRIECYVAMIEYVDLASIIDSAEKKTLIFSSYVEAVDRANELLTKAGYKPMNVYGDTNKNLEAIIKQFDQNANVNPLIATLQSLSTAVPVLSANTIVFLNSPFRVHEREQAISRAHRLGQDTQVYVYDVFLDTGNEPNISTRSGDIMEWSKEQVDLIMGKAGTITIECLADVGLESFYKERVFEGTVVPDKSTLSW